ncbi:uncharacterized protein BCR38DRAFT_442746 [Pseudomassariella vexata]|uniref:Ankyrin repeat protein n=1 Tax=Pseudomassariella vexata TaxID=1141098 RepID=A0A1Y2DQE4_9PEZI|nr:uncharacterized protein BCR38DRAFT_442746 [Pseudomassariella vexata]ORY60875.1 hypothetical protein BCR38DRAFT_442746 [Pseudomassariella vexata]
MEQHTTCLSAEPHNSNVKEHLLHFLGCIEFWDRSAFMNDDDHPLWEGERQHLESMGKTAAEAKALSKAKRELWKGNCRSELRRIDFLREKIKEDKEDYHLVQKVEESRIAWRNSDEYQNNHKDVQRWRDNNDKKNGHPPAYYDPAVDISKTTYVPEKDVSVPFIQFENGQPKEEDEDKSVPVWGSFPDQKTNLASLLDPEKHEKSLLSKDKNPDRIKYFHLPSNNMKWAEEAVARYFNQDRPDFHAIRRDIQKYEKTETALVLKESHWRGQLHGERVTVSSRFMRPFCERVSSNVHEVDHVPRNVVLFMPYLHWETSRNRERFSQQIEEIVFNDRKAKRKKEKLARDARKKARAGLTKRTFPPLEAEKKEPSFVRRVAKYTKENNKLSGNESSSETESGTANEDDSETDEKQRAPTQRRFRSTERILTMGTLLKKLKLPPSPLNVDNKRRVEAKSDLGQYLIDAARLFEGMSHFRDKKLLQFIVTDPPMHPRRTLDQAYYWTLNTTRSRDRDQVVYRATTAHAADFHRWDPKKGWEDHKSNAQRPCDGCTESIKKVSRVVMVDQLWMWILDARTIITCFPKRYGSNKNDSSGVHKSVRRRIAEGRHKQVKSVFDLALIILEECSNTFFDRTRTSDKQPQVLDAFSEAIGNVMHKQTMAFERLWRWTDEIRKHYRSQSRGFTSEIQLPLLDISPEGELEKEIKDILEELGIMIYINKTHRHVVKQFITNVDHILDPAGELGAKPGQAVDLRKMLVRGSSSANVSLSKPQSPVSEKDVSDKDTYHWFKVNADELMNRINDRVEQLEELERSAEITAESVKDLLGLKQQQAGVVQAWQSGKQSDEAIKQGRSVMIFTIVTIVFLPLSFMSSIFGMNSIDFSPEGNTMTLREQFKYMFAVSAGVIVVTLVMSLSSWARAISWYTYKRAVTSLCVHTGLYKKSLDFKIPSHELYTQAIEATDKLKNKEIETRLRERRRRRRQEEKEALKNKSELSQAQSNDIIEGVIQSRKRWGRKSATGDPDVESGRTESNE